VVEVKKSKKDIAEPNWDAFMDYFQHPFEVADEFKVDKTTQKLADDFLEEAKSDLHSADVMYADKNYAKAVYFLQQSSEKAIKSYLLNLGRIHKKDIRPIRHDSPLGFVTMISKMGDFVEKAKALHPHLKTDTTEFVNVVKNPKKRLEHAKISYEGIRIMIDLPINTKKILNDGLKKIASEKGTPLSIYFKNPIWYKMVEHHLNKMVDDMFLYLIGCITFPHEAYTRYPDRALKPKDYTLDMGIVKATPELIEHLKGILENMG
jgi:HEPN domain-containing protein